MSGGRVCTGCRNNCELFGGRFQQLVVLFEQHVVFFAPEFGVMLRIFSFRIVHCGQLIATKLREIASKIVVNDLADFENVVEREIRGFKTIVHPPAAFAKLFRDARHRHAAFSHGLLHDFSPVLHVSKCGHQNVS